MRWCRVCILPESRPNLSLDADNVCNACRAHATKREIDWKARRAALQDVVMTAQQNADPRGYDCVIPVSGGKDSTWQTITCLELGLRPLAVTWCPPGRTEIGQRNLNNLIALGVDHIDWRINPDLESRFMIAAFKRFGSTAIPMHLALFNIPLRIAVKFGIPLVIWGENSAFEYGAASDNHVGFKLDAEWLRVYGVTQGTRAEDWLNYGFSEKELAAYFSPTPTELAAAGVRAIFLGSYLEWDPQETHRVAAQYGFQSNSAGPRTGYYDFADIDDDFISIHHWMKWYKFGFTRLFDNLTLEIRNNRLSRSEALAIIAATGVQTPIQDITKLCHFAKFPEEQFYTIAESFRNPEIWQQDTNSVWHIPDFLIKDWNWT